LSAIDSSKSVALETEKLFPTFKVLGRQDTRRIHLASEGSARRRPERHDKPPTEDCRMIGK
jgi:hypothetical protein